MCESASAQFGGEAALPLHYFRVLRSMDVEVWLVAHARTRSELAALFPDCRNILFVEDTAFHRWMWRLGRLVPARLSSVTFGFASRLSTQFAARRIARQLVRREAIDIVHQPMPVSPKEPSLLHGMGCPVVIGPMNGGMTYPPGFRLSQGVAERLALAIGRRATNLLSRWMPGKRKAAVLLVANARTRAALPAGASARVIEMVENGVDLASWPVAPSSRPAPDRATRFVFIGRLVDWKAVDCLIDAFALAAPALPMTLAVIGEGDQRPSLESLARSKGREVEAAIEFTGWLSQAGCAERLRDADCLVLPSLYECGGAVVLEAMASGKPVIATKWGGPADYLDSGSGILVEPKDRDSFVDGLREAMLGLAASPATRAELGARGRAKVIADYDWDRKVVGMLDVYREAIAGARS